MNERQHDTRVALRRVVRVDGADSNNARLAAIEFCYAHNVNPHWRYPVWPEIIDPSPGPMLTPAEVPVEEEWQRVVRRFAADPAS